jgi:hypothetical protein
VKDYMGLIGLMGGMGDMGRMGMMRIIDLGFQIFRFELETRSLEPETRNPKP